MKKLIAHTTLVLVLGSTLAGCSPASVERSATTVVAGDLAKDDATPIREAVAHAREAERQGARGDAQELVAHAEAALNFTKQAQKSHPTREHLRQATEALGQAIEEGRKGDASTAAQRVHDAILELLKAEDVQASPTSKTVGETSK